MADPGAALAGFIAVVALLGVVLVPRGGLPPWAIELEPGSSPEPCGDKALPRIRRCGSWIPGRVAAVKLVSEGRPRWISS